jgi:hypothetical protein
LIQILSTISGGYFWLCKKHQPWQLLNYTVRLTKTEDTPILNMYGAYSAVVLGK